MPDPPKTPISMALSTPNDMLSGMAPVRKRLIVEGHVQGVGYRAVVTLRARDLKVKGVIRNLPDETVEIVCEGEPEALAGLIKAIDQKGDPADVFSLNVVSIKEAPPAPEGELTRFYTDYGRKLTNAERDSFDREEIMVYRGGTLNSNVGVVGKNVYEVGQKVDSMHLDMNTRFDHMAEHYDMIAISLKEAIVHMDRNAEKTDRAIEKSRKESAAESARTRKEIAKSRKETVIEVRKSQKETAKILAESRNEVAASNRELAKAVNFMIRKLSDKPARKRPAVKRKR